MRAVACGLVLVVAAAGPTAALAAPGDDVPAADAENSGLWFVELSSPPTADGTSLSTTRAEKAAFRAEALAAELRYEERFAFDRLWNGVSVDLGETSPSALARLPSVKRAYPIEHLSLPPTDPFGEPDLFTAKAMTGADAAQQELGLTGSGVRVAVMDTGIDYHHPDLGGCFGRSCRVVAGHDFVGDAFNADRASSAYNPTPAPDPDPDDCGGHGTHVAGIVGAGGAVTGLAPQASLGAYRVFGCAGSTTADIMIAAMERALADDMDVLNMSIGSAFQWPQYPTAQAADRLVNQGVSVVASIGNSGTSGVYAAGAPGVGEKVIGVASFDNSHQRMPIFTVGPDDRRIPHLQASAAPAHPTAGTVPIARSGTSSSAADACGPLPTGSLAGKVALVRRGSCVFYVKAINAERAGAVGVVLYNNGRGHFSATVAGDPPVTIPVVTISDDDGVLIDNRLASGEVQLTWTDEMDSVPSPTGGLISSFSSFGPAPDLSLKPDIGAPGGAIHSTYPLELGGYATVSGTSMSSPHVAGGVALLLQARPRTPSNAVRSILQNSADPRAWWGNPALGFLDNVHRQGAGMLDIPGAVLATTKVEPGKLSFGESEGGPATRTLTIGNDAETAKTYRLAHEPALATRGSTFTPSYDAARATVAFASAGVPVTAVTVPARETATVDVTTTAPASLQQGAIYGGYVVLRNADDSQDTARVPYIGLKGDYQSIQALAPTSSGFPWLARATAGTYAKVPPASATFSMVGDDLPYVLVHFEHQVRRLRLDVVDADTGASWHRALDAEFLGRNSTPSSFFAFSWDGTTSNGRKTRTVPDGQYVLKLTAVKALGSEPDDVETYATPAITIDRTAPSP